MQPVKELVKGERVALGSLGMAGPFEVSATLALAGGADFSVFGLDGAGRLSDDRYMVFWNQPRSPCNGVRLERSLGNATTFGFDLERLPAGIERLVIAVALEGPSTTLADCQGGELVITQGGHVRLRFALPRDALGDERALMLADIYRRDGGWRLCANAQGFKGGLEALVRYFGGSVSDAPAQSPEGGPAPRGAGSVRVSLEKKVQAQAPQLLSLAKKARISLEKQRLTETVARVALVLDCSGSMHWQYKNGRVQEVVNRVLPLAVHFDDDGSLDCWVFGENPLALPAATLANCAHYVESAGGGWRAWTKQIGRAINNEPEVLRAVMDAFADSRLPAYVIFISDGGVARSKDIERLVIEAARMPIFFQFVGLGGRGYGILEHLDSMGGRLVDNANFFALDDLNSIDEQTLYDRLLAEFPDWLKAARGASLI